MKAFYDARSKLVHGGELKPKQHDTIARVDDLRAHVRRLLRAFVLLAIRDDAIYTRTFFRERLDSALLNEVQRNELRKALGLRE